MKPSPVISILLLVFLCLLGLLVFSATVFGQDQAGTPTTTATLFSATIYPEPVGGQLNVKVEGTHPNEVLVFQLIRVNGEVVYTRNFHSDGSTTVKTIRRPMIETGYYLFRVVRKTNGQMTQGRITFK